MMPHFLVRISSRHVGVNAVYPRHIIAAATDLLPSAGYCLDVSYGTGQQ